MVRVATVGANQHYVSFKYSTKSFFGDRTYVRQKNRNCIAQSTIHELRRHELDRSRRHVQYVVRRRNMEENPWNWDCIPGSSWHWPSACFWECMFCCIGRYR